MPRKRLTDRELAEARYNRAQAEASHACEGIFLTAEERQLFDEFEALRLPHEEREARIVARFRPPKP